MRPALALPLLAALFGVSLLGVVVAAQSGDPRGKPSALKVMTYNIKHGQTNAVCTQPAPAAGQAPVPDCNLDLKASLAVIRSHDPDIVGVQEVDRSWPRSAHQDEPAILAEGSGLEHYCYGANLDHQPDAHGPVPHQYGTVILSRFPILECTNTLLPKTGDNEQRGLTLAVIDVHGVRLRFYNTHLHTTAADRSLQTAEVARILESAGDGARILVGDFNARPSAPEMAPLLARFTDAWKQAATPDAGNPEGHTSPAQLAGTPTSRIDYVFVSGDVSVASALVPIDASTRLASDHYPVVVTLRLPRAPGGAAARVY